MGDLQVRVFSRKSIAWSEALGYNCLNGTFFLNGRERMYSFDRREVMA
jgi:hypothetical protein